VELRRIQRGERIAMYGGVLLALGVFLPWYHLKSELAVLGDKSGPANVSGWQAHNIVRFLLILAAAAPFILAYIIAQDHALSWPRGEMTAVVAIAAFGLIAYHTFIDKPGNAQSLVSLRYGAFVAILGTVFMLVGAATRSSETERARKPPGTI
jgi:hypothetical protein